MPVNRDNTVLQATLSSKTKAFEKAFNEHWQVIYNQACRKIQSEQMARDLTQEVFIVLWNHYDQLTSQDTLLPYLYGVLRNKVFQQYEKDAVRLRYAVSIVANKTLQEDFEPEDLLQHKQLLSIVTDEVAKMPPRMKEVYLLKKEDNLSIQEIAVKLQISEQTVKNQLQQAYIRLRVRLKDYRLPLLFIGLALYQ